MAERDVAIAEIQSCKLHLTSAKNLLTPIEDFLDLDPPLVDPQGAYNYILLAINECTLAVDALQQSSGQPILQFNPTSMTFNSPEGAKLLNIANVGTATLSGTAVPRDPEGGAAPNWLSVQPQSFSVPESGSTDITVSIVWNNIPIDTTVLGEIYIDSNGGTGVVAITAIKEATVGEPVLLVQPTSLGFQHPGDLFTFTVLNVGDQTQMLDWTATQALPYNWMSHYPTSGQITTYEQVTVDIDWDTWPTQQGIVTRAGNIIVGATYQGNPAQGSPQTVAVTAQRDTGAGSGAPNCIGGTCEDDPNCNAVGCGTGAWYGWCVKFQHGDPPHGIQDIGGLKAFVGMGISSGEARVRTSRYFPDANDVIVRMDLNFDQQWITGAPGGGKHFFAIGSCPCGGRGCFPPESQLNCIRADVALGIDGLLNRHPRDGFKIDVYNEVDGNSRVQGTDVFSNEVWPDADTWYHWEFHAVHSPSSGKLSGKMVYGKSSGTVEVPYSINIQPNNPTPLSKWYVGFGNCSDMPLGAVCLIDNFSVTVGGQTLAI